MALLPALTTSINHKRMFSTSICALHLLPSELLQCQRPCRNGGVCVGFNRCQCAKGFVGELCETGQCAARARAGITPLCLLLMPIFSRPVAVTIPCVPPCQHGATCSPHNTCTCPEGTAGLRCERLWVSVVISNKRGRAVWAR